MCGHGKRDIIAGIFGLIRPWHIRNRCVVSIICTHFRIRGCASSVGYYYFTFLFSCEYDHVNIIIYDNDKLSFCVFVYLKPLCTLCLGGHHAITGSGLYSFYEH